MSLLAPSRAALVARSPAPTAPSGASRRCSLPLAATPAPKARALVGAFGASKARRSIQSLIRPPRASPSDARDALSSSLRDDEQAALDAFLASGGDDAKAKALMVEAATTKVGEGRGREREKRKRKGKREKTHDRRFSGFFFFFLPLFRSCSSLCSSPIVREQKQFLACVCLNSSVSRER